MIGGRKLPDGATFAVFAGLAANAITAFSIQAWMTFSFAAKVWQIPTPLCVALVVALDVFAIMFMVLTYLLRGTGWPRFVVTATFVGAIASQVFAAEMFGSHEGWVIEVRWFSALPAVALAASQEGVILWRTHRADRVASSPPKAAARPSAAAEKPQAKEIEVAPTPPPSRKPRRSRPAPDHDAIAIRAIRGESTKALAAEQDVSTKSVQNWVNAYRARHPLTEIPAKIPVATTVNGVKPQLNQEVST